MKVTIITPTLNNGQKLCATIESVAAQDYQDIEMIVIDGGSTDDSLDIIREFDSRYPRLIYWLSEEDQGIYNAINKGLSMATGDIIGTLHGGDFLVGTDIISRVVDAFSRHPDTPFLYGDVHYVNSAGRCVRLYSGTADLREGLRRGIAPPHPSLFITRHTASLIGGYREDYQVAADFELFARMAFVHDLHGYYLPLDMVAMTLGGKSTRFYNRLVTNNLEKMRSLRENGVSRTGLGVFRRYFFTPFQ